MYVYILHIYIYSSVTQPTAIIARDATIIRREAFRFARLLRYIQSPHIHFIHMCTYKMYILYTEYIYMYIHISKCVCSEVNRKERRLSGIFPGSGAHKTLDHFYFHSNRKNFSTEYCHNYYAINLLQLIIFHTSYIRYIYI